MRTQQLLLVTLLVIFSICNCDVLSSSSISCESTSYDPSRFIMENFDDQLLMSLRSSERVVSVLGYGAKGDGVSDDGVAFEKAWSDACTSSAPSVLLVPEKKTYLLKPITFSGPCKSSVYMMINGTIVAPSDPSDWNEQNRRHWILFNSITNLAVGGSGTINGNGQIWWENSCKINKSLPCRDAPTALTFYSCNQLTVENLKITNSQQIHVSFEKCSNVMASSLNINSPEKSPNTDGIHITRTTNINVTNCVIATGDDCISIETGSQGVRATNIICGPGHGISIGSLGDDNSQAQVSNVLVDTAELSGTSNGLRIKTWQGGSGYAKGITFQNVHMNNVKNPIIIDQKYCDSDKPCGAQKSAVEVSNVIYKNIKGTSASQVAIDFDCSNSVPCHGIVLQDINLAGVEGKTESSCKNVKYNIIGTVIPPACV